MKARWSGFTLWFLLAAFALCVAAAAGLSVERQRDVYNLFFVLDLTRSMNARDYGTKERALSRLDMAKATVTDLTRRLPCGSKVGFGVFTERRTFPLIEPVEICANFAPFSDAIAALDWRMAWEGDSRVVRGLASAQDLVDQLDSDLVFITDGHEAPPLPLAGRRSPPDPERTAGVILGAGGHELVPIPKYDDLGNPTGFYSLEDIAAGARVSIISPGASSSGKYHPRNNPVGNLAATSTEHLTSVREDYLREIAAEAGLGYAPLDDLEGIKEAIAAHTSAHRLPSRQDLSPVFGAAALLSLLAAYGGNFLISWRRSRPTITRPARFFLTRR